jgi:hypothetical protein
MTTPKPIEGTVFYLGGDEPESPPAGQLWAQIAVPIPEGRGLPLYGKVQITPGDPPAEATVNQGLTAEMHRRLIGCIREAQFALRPQFALHPFRTEAERREGQRALRDALAVIGDEPGSLECRSVFSDDDLRRILEWHDEVRSTCGISADDDNLRKRIVGALRAMDCGSVDQGGEQ